jgi:hypothetical protein
MKLNPGRLKDASFTRNVFAICVEPTVSIGDVIKPDFWSHVAAKLHPSDRVEVTTEDGKWFAELYVVACDKTWAQVTLLRKHDLVKEKKEPTNPEFKHVWRGANHKHSILRVSDDTVLKDGFDTKQLAVDYLNKHLETISKAS